MRLFIQAAHAAPETAGAAGLFGQILLPVAFVAIFYFLVIRPQSMRTKEHRPRYFEASHRKILQSTGIYNEQDFN